MTPHNDFSPQLDNNPKNDTLQKKGQRMVWQVILTDKAEKRSAKLPFAVLEALRLLMADIASGGPVRGNWKNYSKLSGNRHHCHIKTGRPTYVAVWEVTDNRIRLIEVIYAGTHENAPY